MYIKESFAGVFFAEENRGEVKINGPLERAGRFVKDQSNSFTM